MAGFVADFRRSWRTARTLIRHCGGRPDYRRPARRTEVPPPRADHGPVAAGPLYSARSATSGSTRVARRAGIQHATTVTETSTTAIAMKVIGSVALTP